MYLSAAFVVDLLTSVRRGMPAILLSTYHTRIKPDAHHSTACHARHLTTATRSLRLIALFLCERRYTK